MKPAVPEHPRAFSCLPRQGLALTNGIKGFLQPSCLCIVKAENAELPVRERGASAAWRRLDHLVLPSDVPTSARRDWRCSDEWRECRPGSVTGGR
jgi:hypothetical protein